MTYRHPIHRTTPPCGFTLIELLVVITIIASLAALSFGVVTKMIHKSRTAASVNNLKQLYAAAHGFAADSYDVFPATYTDSGGLTSSNMDIVHWWEALGPYLYDDYNDKLDGTFRDAADPRVKTIEDDQLVTGSWDNTSYMPWINGTTNDASHVSGISLARTDSLSGQPYLSTAESGNSPGITDESTYSQYVMPSADWRDGSVIVLYCDGNVQVIKNPTYRKVAPAMADTEY